MGELRLAAAKLAKNLAQRHGLDASAKHGIKGLGSSRDGHYPLAQQRLLAARHKPNRNDFGRGLLDLLDFGVAEAFNLQEIAARSGQNSLFEEVR